MTRVVAVSAQAESTPGMRVRVGVPAPELSRLGIAVERLPLLTDSEFREFRAASVASRVALCSALAEDSSSGLT